jgi:hypothetical protein
MPLNIDWIWKSAMTGVQLADTNMAHIFPIVFQGVGDAGKG